MQGGRTASGGRSADPAGSGRVVGRIGAAGADGPGQRRGSGKAAGRSPKPGPAGSETGEGPAGTERKAGPAGTAARGGRIRGGDTEGAGPGDRPSTAQNRTAARTRPGRAALKDGRRSARREAPTRLTAAGVGIILSFITLAGGMVDALLFDGPDVIFGVVFLCGCVYTAARVRPCDLIAAPVAAPIAFAITLAVTVPASGRGLSGQVLSLATSLAMHAGWLFAGTLLAACLALLRKLTLRSQRSTRQA